MSTSAMQGGHNYIAHQVRDGGLASW